MERVQVPARSDRPPRGAQVPSATTTASTSPSAAQRAVRRGPRDRREHVQLDRSLHRQDRAPGPQVQGQARGHEGPTGTTWSPMPWEHSIVSEAFQGRSRPPAPAPRVRADLPRGRPRARVQGRQDRKVPRAADVGRRRDRPAQPEQRGVPSCSAATPTAASPWSTSGGRRVRPDRDAGRARRARPRRPRPNAAHLGGGARGALAARSAGRACTTRSEGPW